MDYMNRKMRKIIDRRIIDGSCLSWDLRNIFDIGLEKYKECVFLKLFLNNNVKFMADRKSYFDMSGFEYTTNKFHAADYFENCKNISPILLLDKFSEIWCKNYRTECNVVIAYDVDPTMEEDFIFTFYQQRDSEDVIDLSDLESFNQPLLVRRIIPKIND